MSPKSSAHKRKVEEISRRYVSSLLDYKENSFENDSDNDSMGIHESFFATFTYYHNYTTVNSIAPCPRWVHTMTLLEQGHIILYGVQKFDSHSEVHQTLSDFHVYDINTHTFSKPIICDSVARTLYTTTFFPDRKLLVTFSREYFKK